MSSLRQIEANRRNAQLSTEPVTQEGKKRSRRNTLRHGLTAETVIHKLEDADDYAGFEMAVTDDYDAQSPVERELVLRLASVLWRLRRATAIEAGLFKIQARDLLQFRQARPAHQQRQLIIENLYSNAAAIDRAEPVQTETDQLHSDAPSPRVGAVHPIGESAGRSSRSTQPLRANALASGLPAPVHAGVLEPRYSTFRYPLSPRIKTCTGN